LNNNRNNRRRGRGNRPQGGGSQLNRIDSRARGNAPQLLDKYKKLAQDAQHNGDRVQMEYYLQFADHYFRVIADNKARQDEARGRRPDERDQANDDDYEDDFDDRRRGRGSRDNFRDGEENGRTPDNTGDEAEFEPAENPFVRDNRTRQRSGANGAGGSAGERTRQPRRTRRPASEDQAEPAGEIDAAVLPPSIASAPEGDDAPAPRRRRRKAAEPQADGDGSLSAVG